MEQEHYKGLLIIYTGPGKGKTTAALGLGLRAVGNGLKVLMLQFIKGSWPSGEREAAELLPGFSIEAMGLGFTWDTRHTPEEHRQALLGAWERAKQAISSGDHDVVILDELNNAFNIANFPMGDILTPEAVIDFLSGRPPHVHVVITGRNAPQELLDKADLVTEMRDIKHPFHSGRGAVKGIDF